MVAGDTADAGEPDRAAWALPRKEEAVPAGRHAFLELARRVLGPGDLATDAELLLSELLTNAITHGAGPDIRVVIALHVEVHDDGVEGSPTVQEGGSCDPTRPDHGRGLFLVEALASEWGTRQDDAGTTAWFEIDLPTEMLPELRDPALRPLGADPANGAA